MLDLRSLLSKKLLWRRNNRRILQTRFQDLIKSAEGPTTSPVFVDQSTIGEVKATGAIYYCSEFALCYMFWNFPE